MRNSRGVRPVGRRFEALEYRQLLSVTPIDGQQHGAGCGCAVCAMPAIDPPSAAELASLAELAPDDMPEFPESMPTVPVFHSNPNATDFLHLDFDGHFQPVWGAWSNVTTPAYDTNGDASTFSQSELNAIYEIFVRVAEDFAPFNIDVTTEDRGDYSNRVGLKVAIGGSYNDWYGGAAGGVGYVNSYTSSIANTVYVFVDGTGGGVAKYVAEASSHEAGHGYGLQHQSTYDTNGNKTAEYNPGAGLWGPIMGVGYNRSITTWHNGPNSNGSTSFQDDMAILASSNNSFGYKTDDVGNSRPTATALPIVDGAPLTSGLITTPTDGDYFSFSTVGGPLHITAQGVQYGTNVDLIVQLQDASGNQVAIAQPSNSFNATVQANVPAGNYYVVIKTVDTLYGRAGVYNLSGSISQHLPTGALEIIDPSTAAVTGWALDGDDATDSVSVNFRIDGVPQGGNVLANLSHPSQGAHGYSWDIPLAFHDGQRHTLEFVALDVQGGAATTLATRDFVLFPGLVLGDATGDGFVTGADYTIWADNFEDFAGTATVAEGDFNGDGYVTGADYTLWADGFTGPAPPAGLNTSSRFAAIDQALTSWERDLAPTRVRRVGEASSSPTLESSAKVAAPTEFRLQSVARRKPVAATAAFRLS